MKTKVAVYCRADGNDPFAVECQKAALWEYISAHPDWDAGTVYADIAPASQLTERSDLAHLLEDAEKGEFQRVAVHSASRLARDRERLYQIVNALKVYGVSVDFLKEGLSTDDMV